MRSCCSSSSLALAATACISSTSSGTPSVEVLKEVAPRFQDLILGGLQRIMGAASAKERKRCCALASEVLPQTHHQLLLEAIKRDPASSVRSAALQLYRAAPAVQPETLTRLLEKVCCMDPAAPLRLQALRALQEPSARVLQLRVRDVSERVRREAVSLLAAAKLEEVNSRDLCLSLATHCVFDAEVKKAAYAFLTRAYQPYMLKERAFHDFLVECAPELFEEEL